MTASVKTIKRQLNVTSAVAVRIRAALAHGASGDHQAVDDALDKIDECLSGFGVEAISGNYVDRYYQNIVVLFVNMGDMYANTVIYETDTGRFILTTVGDWVEHNADWYGIP